MGVKLSSVRRGWLLAIVGVCAMGMSAPRMQAKAAGAASVSVQPEQTAPLASSGDEKGQQPTGQYRLSQERYEKAVAFSRAEYRLHFVSAAWGIAALLLVLRLGVVARLRDFAEAWGGGSRWLQAAIFVSALLGVLAVLHLPLRVYGHTLVVRYELSVQGWGSWLWDWTKGQLLTIGLAIEDQGLMEQARACLAETPFRVTVEHGCLDDRVGNGVDQPETEERRRVSLRPCDSELANREGALSEGWVARQQGRPDLCDSRLGPAVSRGIDATAVRHR